MINLTTDLMKTLKSISAVLWSALAKIDDLKTDQIENRMCVMRLQGTVIKSKKEQVRGYSDRCKDWIQIFQWCSETESLRNIRQKVASSFEIGSYYNNQRRQCIMGFGLEDNRTQVLTDIVNQVLGTVVEGEKPTVKECFHVGTAKQSATRPVMICFISSGSVALLLHNVKKSKQNTAFRKICLSSDWSLGLNVQQGENW